MSTEPSISAELTNDLLRSSDFPVERVFLERLETNLEALGYTGPAKVFGADIVATLFGLLIEAVSGCLGIAAPGAVIARMKNPSAGIRNNLQNKVIRQIYRGSKKDYEEMDGKRVVQSLWKSTQSSTDSELEALVVYASEERIPEPTTPIKYDYGSLVR